MVFSTFMKFLTYLPDNLSYKLIKYVTLYDKEKYFKKYVKLFNLNLENLNKFDDLLDKNIYFEDPFNKVYGIENFKEFFQIL